MTSVCKRPLPRQKISPSPCATQVRSLPMSRPADATSTEQPRPTAGRFSSVFERDRAWRLDMLCRRARDVIVVCLAILVPCVVGSVLIVQLKKPVPVESHDTRLATPTPAPSPLPRQEAPAREAVDVYEFLSVMHGSAFLDESDIPRLLGNPRSVARIAEGVSTRTHLYTGGVVQYRLSSENVVTRIALAEATKRPRHEIKHGDFETGYRLLRVPEYREYCLLMINTRTNGNADPKTSPEPDHGTQLKAAPDTLSEPASTIASLSTSVPANRYDGPPRPSKQADFAEPTGSEAHRTADSQVSRILKTRSKPDPTPTAPADGRSDQPVESYRIWTSADGNYECKAKFAGFKASKVHLRKDDGRTVVLSSFALSDADRLWIREHLKKP